MLLLHWKQASGVGGAKSTERRESATLRSPSHALLLLAQFYGLPAAWLGGRRTHSNNDEEDGVVALLRQRVVSGAKGALGGGWHLPRRRMILESALSAGAPSSAEAASGTFSAFSARLTQTLQQAGQVPKSRGG